MSKRSKRNDSPAVWATHEVVNNQSVTREIAPIGLHPQIELLPLKESEFNGIEMGVLHDGTPYLTLRGLAGLCGVDPSMLNRFASNWGAERMGARGRGKFINQVLLAQGYDAPSLHVRIKSKGVDVNAFPDAVCMAVLEYYAFEASQSESSEIAKKNYRILARESLKAFIYKVCEFSPVDAEAISWKNFHERVLLNEQLPKGHFSVFKEVADIVVRMISQGCKFDHKTIPDISVGQMWGKFWQEVNGDNKYGPRKRHPHHYPDWYPQSAAHGIEPWIYPNAALGDFKDWLDDKYLPSSFKSYIGRKVKEGSLPAPQATKLLGAVMRN